MRTSVGSIAALVAAAAVGGAGIALAQSDVPTQVTIEPAPTLAAGAISPFDGPGVKAVRRGKPIPPGYVLVGQKVTIKRGTIAAGATLYFKCPGGKRLKAFDSAGTASVTAYYEYRDHRTTYLSSYSRSDATGTVYAVCR
jgi:hypothetical protein